MRTQTPSTPPYPALTAPPPRNLTTLDNQERGAAQMVGSDGAGRTGIMPPLATITVCLAVMSVVAHIDDRFNAFSR